MTLLFLSLAIIIAVVVIVVSAKHIKAGVEARSEIKDKKPAMPLSSVESKTLIKLKKKNLSSEDLKRIYKDLQKKK